MTMKKKVKVYGIKPVFSDKRGNIYDILEEMIQHVGMVTFTKKGIIRGNHYHKKSTQYSYVLSGKIKLTTKNLDGKNKGTFMMNEGTFAEIPAGVIHTYESLSRAVMLDMTTASRKESGYEEDTIRVQ